jgi:nitroimidazol reductase NimA-like FMN-containing flavoprotein (pyridoxamine 5'-phosphate oxidase superfamily)
MAFRPMRRNPQALTEEDSKLILKNEKRAVLSVIGDDGYPYGIPINFLYDEDSGCIYFHCGNIGHKIESIRNNDKVCFTVHDQGERREDWSYYVKSVICFGRASEVENGPEKLELTKRFGLKYFPSMEELQPTLDRSFKNMVLVRIRIEHMTGKLVHEK